MGMLPFHMAASPSSDILFCGESCYSFPTLCCSHSSESLLSKDRRDEICSSAPCSGGGGKPPRPPLFFKIYFILFYLEGEEKEGWPRVGAGDVIKAPAEEICGSGVSTSEKSMAAAAVPQGSGAGMWHSQQHFPLSSCSILCLLPASQPHSPTFTELD